MRIHDVDLRLLRVFAAVAHSGGFTAAADRLGIGRPTVSSHMADLEARLGVRLCERGRSGFSLTENGARVLELAQQLFAGVEEFAAEIGALQGHLSGDVNIGQIDYMSSLHEYRMVEVVREFCQEAPGVACHVQVFPGEEVVRQVLDGRLHLGIVSGSEKTTGLDATAVLQEDLYVYCGRTHPLYERSDARISLADLDGARLAGEIARGARLRRQSREPGLDARANNLETVLLLIRSGHYIGYLPEHFAESWVEAGELRPLKSATSYASGELLVVMRKDWRRVPQLARFVTHFMRWHKPLVKTKPPAA
ncbi:MAG: LysR family transcriptional regulator [Pseudomonadota bacterium]